MLNDTLLWLKKTKQILRLSLVSRLILKCLLDQIFHYGLNCDTKFIGGQTRYFVLPLVAFTGLGGGVDRLLVITWSDMAPDQQGAGSVCYSSPSWFTHVAEWILSVVPQVHCNGYPVTSFHSSCCCGYSTFHVPWSLIISNKLYWRGFWWGWWLQLLHNSIFSNCQMLGGHASSKCHRTLGFKLQHIKTSR